eukprot:g5372.t1
MSLSCALGAALGLALAKSFRLTHKEAREEFDVLGENWGINDCQWAYNAAFIGGATAGAALATYLAVRLRKEAVSAAAVLIAAAFLCEGFQQVVHNKFCSWLFRCGCTWEWSGGWDNCNVHNASGPKCPWCVARLSLAWTTDCLPLAVMLLAFSEAKIRGWAWWLRLLLPVLSFFLLGTLVALCFKFTSGYPYFITGPVHGKVP